jgi:YVTN family beta-propeller protein
MKSKSIATGFLMLSATAAMFMWAACASAQSSKSEDPSLEIVDHFKIGGDGGWDFLAVDDKRHHLFVTRGNEVQVVDLESGKLLTTLSHLEGTHGVAIAGDVGFITNGKSNAVTVVDLNTLRPIDTVSIDGVGPDAIVYEPTQRRVYTMNHRSGNITVLDAATRKVIGKIEALGELEVAVTDGNGKIFVNSEATSELAVIDSHSGTMESHWKLGDCKAPTGLAIDAEHARLFSVCANNRMVVLDANSGRLVTELPIGSRPDGAGFDAELGMAYSSNGDGSLTVVHEDDADHFRVVENVSTQVGARTMTIDPQTHRVYLPAASFGPVPPATADTSRPRPPVIAGSFNIIVMAPKAFH